MMLREMQEELKAELGNGGYDTLLIFDLLYQKYAQVYTYKTLYSRSERKLAAISLRSLEYRE